MKNHYYTKAIIKYRLLDIFDIYGEFEIIKHDTKLKTNNPNFLKKYKISNKNDINDFLNIDENFYIESYDNFIQPLKNKKILLKNEENDLNWEKIKDMEKYWNDSIEFPYIKIINSLKKEIIDIQNNVKKYHKKENLILKKINLKFNDNIIIFKNFIILNMARSFYMNRHPVKTKIFNKDKKFLNYKIVPYPANIELNSNYFQNTFSSIIGMENFLESYLGFIFEDYDYFFMPCVPDNLIFSVPIFFDNENKEYIVFSEIGLRGLGIIGIKKDKKMKISNQNKIVITDRLENEFGIEISDALNVKKISDILIIFILPSMFYMSQNKTVSEFFIIANDNDMKLEREFSLKLQRQANKDFKKYLNNLSDDQIPISIINE